MRPTILVILLLISLSGCNFSAQEDVTPTTDAIVEEPINPLPEASVTPFDTETPSPSFTPSLTPTDAPTQIAAVPTQAAPETLTPTLGELPTETPSYWEYVVQPGEQLIEIIQREPFNYRTLDVLPEIVRINPNMYSADILPVGEMIMIPKPTNAPTTTLDSNATTGAVTAAEGTPAPVAGGRTPVLAVRDNVFLPSDDCVYSTHIVVEGETAVEIVENPLYSDCLTLAIFAQINRDISVFGCNFESTSGGENCNIFIGTGQVVQVLIDAPTPTPSPSPSGNETATPTPTFAPPMMQSPPEGAIVNGSVTLAWLSMGILPQGRLYVVTVRDNTAGSIWVNGTSRTSMRLPDALIPADGQAHEIEWSVTIGMEDENGDFVTLDGIGNPGKFYWNSR